MTIIIIVVKLLHLAADALGLLVPFSLLAAHLLGELRIFTSLCNLYLSVSSLQITWQQWMLLLILHCMMH